MSNVTCTLALVESPFELVATAVSVFRPSTSGTVTANLPDPTGALIPFNFTCAFGSPTVPVTVTGLMFV